MQSSHHEEEEGGEGVTYNNWRDDNWREEEEEGVEKVEDLTHEEIVEREVQFEYNWMKSNYCCIRMKRGVKEVFVKRDSLDIKWCGEDYKEMKFTRKTRKQFQKKSRRWHAVSSKYNKLCEMNCAACDKKLIKIRPILDCEACITKYTQYFDYFVCKAELGQEARVEIKK